VADDLPRCGTPPARRVVVGAAGNGAEDLDDALYDTRTPGSGGLAQPVRPPTVVGAVIVVRRTTVGDFGRPVPASFSNSVARLDAQGWGREVVSTGGSFDQAGDLQGVVDETRWYTEPSAVRRLLSPIVVGTLAAIQGMQFGAGRVLLTPGRPSRCCGPQVRRSRTARTARQSTDREPAGSASAMASLAPSVIQSGLPPVLDELQPSPAGSTRSLWFYVNAAWRLSTNPARSSRTWSSVRSWLGSTVRVWHENDVVVGLVVSGS